VVTTALLALLALLLVACSSTPEPAPRTARVTRASVSTGVTASGSLTALTEQNLGFSKGGQLTTVSVKVGDRVAPGQVLATIDDFALKQTLAQQQAQLNSQQAVLNRILNGTAVPGASDSLSQAKKILDATEKQVDATKKSDRSAVDRAEKQLSFDKRALDDAEDGGTTSSSSGGGGASVSSALCSSLSGSSKSKDDDDDSKDKSNKEGSADLSAELAALAQSLCSGQSSSSSSTPTSNDTAVTAAERQVEASRTALEAARQREKVDAAQGDLSIENARQGVVTAQNNFNSASTERPFNVDQQRALVANAAAIVAAAQRDVDDATLRAPVGGTVSAINGAVGEFLAASSGTTALAPGSDAAIPGAALASSSSQTGATPVRPGGGQFLVLEDVNQLQVVLPFEESDAAKITPNQKVIVGFDAIPDLTRNGTVLSVSPTGTSIAGVISYYVTVVLTETDPRLKDGQTARATVVTTQLDNVLSVPNAAVRKEGGQNTVTVVGANGDQRPVPFEAGLVGADRTQVLSGLFEGQEILLPTGP
jgi:HlyD family secretion protein